MCILLVLVCAGSAAQQPSVTPMLKNVYRFWLQHGPDEKYGEPMSISVAQCRLHL
jgi:hypothetical protein